MQDWNGNKKAVFVTNGDSSHSQQARAGSMRPAFIA